MDTQKVYEMHRDILQKIEARLIAKIRDAEDNEHLNDGDYTGCKVDNLTIDAMEETITCDVTVCYQDGEETFYDCQYPFEWIKAL